MQPRQAIADPQPRESHQHEQSTQIGRRPIHAGDPISSVCLVPELARLLDVSESRIYQLHHEGKLRDFALPSIGGRLQFNGKRLSDWREGKFEPKASALRIIGRKVRG